MDALHILDCVLLEKGQAIETDDNALLFRVQFGLDTGVIYFMKLYLMFYPYTFWWDLFSIISIEGGIKKISWKCRCEIRNRLRLHKEFDSIVHWFGRHVGLAQSLTFVSDGHVRWILFFCSIAGKQIVSIVMYTHLQLSSRLSKSSVVLKEYLCESRIELIFAAR